MDSTFEAHGVTLACHLARAGRGEPDLPALVLCHEFPSGVAGAGGSARSYPQLADRIAVEVGWLVLTFNFRGAGDSEGQFSLGGWLADLQGAVAHLRTSENVSRVLLAGFGTGGALAIVAGALDPSIEAVAALGTSADFDDWAGNPRRLLQHARDINLITDPSYPPSLEEWTRDLRRIRPITSARALAPRPLLVLHGSEDESVPVFDARVLSDAHGSAELRIIDGAGHQLRHDPRAIAVLLGWLDRQKHRVPASG
jgi:putative redox protein